jgi:hypothetical protein
VFEWTDWETEFQRNWLIEVSASLATHIIHHPCFLPSVNYYLGYFFSFSLAPFLSAFSDFPIFGEDLFMCDEVLASMSCLDF